MFPAGEVQISANVTETQQNLPALQGAYSSISTQHMFPHDTEGVVHSHETRNAMQASELSTWSLYGAGAWGAFMRAFHGRRTPKGIVSAPGRCSTEEYPVAQLDSLQRKPLLVYAQQQRALHPCIHVEYCVRLNSFPCQVMMHGGALSVKASFTELSVTTSSTVCEVWAFMQRNESKT